MFSLPQGYNAFQSYGFGAQAYYPTQPTSTPSLFTGGFGGLQSGFGVQGGFGVQAGFWSQMMQVQQNLFQGWQNFCGCSSSNRNSNNFPNQFGGHHHDRFRNCFGGRPRGCEGPRRPTCGTTTPTVPTTPTTPTVPTAPTTPVAPVATTPPPALTRSTVSALPSVRTQTSTALPTTTVTNRGQATAAHNYGAFGPAGNFAGFVPNVSYYNNVNNNQAISMGTANSVVRY